MTVAIMPEVDDVEVQIDPKDYKFDVFRASGNGGQCVNTTDSAVRLTHFPSGIVISCQDEKSQLKNKDKALKILRARLYDLEQQKQHDEMAELRKSQVGTGDRSEKIRTYNFPQGRVTDHRIKLTLYKLDAIMNGDLDEIIDSLIAGRSIIINAANHDWSTGSIVDRINKRKKGKRGEKRKGKRYEENSTCDHGSRNRQQIWKGNQAA